jgi:hypothetical protein
MPGKGLFSAGSRFRSTSVDVKRCAGRTAAGKPCAAWPLQGTAYCPFHTPGRAAELGRRGGSAGPRLEGMAQSGSRAYRHWYCRSSQCFARLVTGERGARRRRIRARHFRRGRRRARRGTERFGVSISAGTPSVERSEVFRRPLERISIRWLLSGKWLRVRTRKSGSSLTRVCGRGSRFVGLGMTVTSERNVVEYTDRLVGDVRLQFADGVPDLPSSPDRSPYEVDFRGALRDRVRR